MSIATKYGQFVWRDLICTDAAKVEAFYTQLFGWTVNAVDMGGGETYRMLGHNGQEFGGIGQWDEGLDLPSAWRSYVTVENTDEATAQAVKLGGQVVEAPTDIPNVGRFSVVTDPTGAAISPFYDPKAADWLAQQAPTVGTVGSVVWNELTTTDPQRVIPFYTSLFGWTTEGDIKSYVTFKDGDQSIGGLMPATPEMPMAAWIIYFHVADLDQSRAEVTRLGGQNVSDVIDVPDIGRVSWATDPTGAFFALHEDPRG
ncbi:MAG TPA: VOC family protein [Thermomicrobiales bacterium]|nr:VOC family protein [Thermomicrobiales bacterium]